MIEIYLLLMAVALVIILLVIHYYPKTQHLDSEGRELIPVKTKKRKKSGGSKYERQQGKQEKMRRLIQINHGIIPQPKVARNIMGKASPLSDYFYGSLLSNIRIKIIKREL